MLAFKTSPDFLCYTAPSAMVLDLRSESRTAGLVSMSSDP